MTLWIRGGPALRDLLVTQLGPTRSIELEAHCAFVRVDGASAPGASGLGSLIVPWSSEHATDVLWLTAQPAIDAFEFHHARAGAILRILIYGCSQERIWETIEGSPEPWESWRRPPKLGSMNFSFHGDPVAEVSRHYRLTGMGIPLERQAAPKKRPPAKPFKFEKRRR